MSPVPPDRKTELPIQHGQAMVEFLIVIPVMLLILLGTLQFALIYQAKITLNYAAFEAARAGSLSKAREFAMYDAVARNMAAIYTHDSNIDAYKAGRQVVRDQIDNGYVLIETINPSPDSFSDFGYTKSGETTIPNDNLIYRCASQGSDSSQTGVRFEPDHSGCKFAENPGLLLL